MATPKKGTLTIVGSGIASIRHMTLETLSYIETADKIHYALIDPPTEAFIHKKCKDSSQCFDLTIYYDSDKPRYETYVQMAEVMLRDVRQGYNVLGVFYGHPGVFVFPSHRAIAIAREEGYVAKMLPGVSAEDYMFSDLGFDPANPGCMTQEATGLLVSGKKLDPFVHNIIWQVGGVGVDTMIFNNRKFGLLVDRLEEDFGPNHTVIHYIGAVLPQSTAIIDEYTVAELRQEGVVRQIVTSSTFYIPPRSTPEINQEMLKKLKSSVDGESHIAMQVYPRPKWVMSDSPSAPAYGSFEQQAVSRLENHTMPRSHHVLRGSPALHQFMVDLALQPDLCERYKADPASVVDTVVGLSAQEKFALTLNHPTPVFRVMRDTQERIDSGKELTLDELAAVTVIPEATADTNIPILCIFGIIVIVIAF